MDRIGRPQSSMAWRSTGHKISYCPQNLLTNLDLSFPVTRAKKKKRNRIHRKRASISEFTFSWKKTWHFKGQQGTTFSNNGYDIRLHRAESNRHKGLMYTPAPTPQHFWLKAFVPEALWGIGPDLYVLVLGKRLLSAVLQRT